MTDRITPYRIISKEEKEGSKIELKAEIPHEHLIPFRKRVFDSIRKTLEVPGFRPGKATDDVIEKHLGSFPILEKVAGEALAEIYPQIIVDNDIDAVGHPHISITKLAPENALAFTADVFVMPKLTLTDYSASAKKGIASLSAPDVLVTEDEIEKSLLNLRKRIAHTKWHEEHPDDETHGHGDIPDAELPELTDDVVKTVGPYENAAALREETRKMLEEDKKNRERSRRRAAIADQIIKDTPFVIPEVFVDGELSMMLGEFRQTLAHMGTTLDDYLKNIKKTQEELKKEWRSDAEKRARLQLIINKISEKEKLIPEEEKIMHEVAHLIEHHPNAKEENIRAYVESLMRNDMVFDFLDQESK